MNSKREKHPGTEKSSQRALLGMREKLLAGTSGKSARGSLKDEPQKGDEADMAGEEQYTHISSLLNMRDKEKLAAIGKALKKIKDSEYGICEECGEDIGRGRLKVMPLAKFCIICQETIEKNMTAEMKAEGGLSSWEGESRDSTTTGDEEP